MSSLPPTLVLASSLVSPLDLSRPTHSSSSSSILHSASPSPVALTTPLPSSPPTSPDSSLRFANFFEPRGSKEYSFPSEEGGGEGGSSWGSEGGLSLDVDEADPPGLRIEDRSMMDELMSVRASRAACEMAAEVVGLIVPALSKKSGHNSKTRFKAAEQQKRMVASGLFLWTNLAPSPLIALIVTVVFLERLVASHPKMGEVITRDAPLRIAFAAFLLALKVTSDCSHLNKSFVHYTPWKLHDLNAMEKQLLEYLGFDLWISSEEILHRASAFWVQHKTPPSSSSDGDLSSFLGNLFLMQPREGVHEKSWRGGLVRGSGESGTRMSREGSSAGEEDQGGESTVWRRGRLERREEMDQFGKEREM